MRLKEHHRVGNGGRKREACTLMVRILNDLSQCRNCIYSLAQKEKLVGDLEVLSCI